MKKIMIALTLALLPLASKADDNMSFHGTLIAPPCTISSGKTIEVAFGNDLGVNKIDGNSYKQPVNYSIDCEAGYNANSLAIVLDTTRPAIFDSSAVSTDKAGLGIRLLVDGVAVTFATRVAVSNPASPPTIEAVPVRDPATTLTAGAFDATVTLRVDYL